VIVPTDVVRLYHERPDGTRCILRNADGEPLAFHDYPLLLTVMLKEKVPGLNLVVRREHQLQDTRFPIVWDPEDVYFPAIQAAVDSQLKSS
jgi:hypothetical protein